MTEPSFPPVLSYQDILQTDVVHHGYLKCRLVHMEDRSFVLPDVIMIEGATNGYYSPQFFHPNHLSWFGGDGSADFCRLRVEVLGQVDFDVIFFGSKVVKHCDDGSFIYECGIKTVGTNILPAAQGCWRRCDERFELALYHHTTKAGAAGINESQELWSSAWNIQGTCELKNVAYGYFTCIPIMDSMWHLQEVAMAENGQALFLPTNAPNDAQFAVTLDVYQRTVRDIEVPLQFWVDVETLSPSYLWLHVPTNAATYYEVVLPKVFRVGTKPGQTIPIRGDQLEMAPKDCHNFDYVIVGDGDTHDGLIAPYREEETLQLAKVDHIPSGIEIIQRWYQQRNTALFDGISVEVAALVEGQTS